jgi:hypothetical protein
MPLTMWISGLGDDSRQPPVEMVDSVTFPKAHTSGGAIAALANPLLHTKIRRHAQEEQLRRPLNDTRLMALPRELPPELILKIALKDQRRFRLFCGVVPHLNARALLLDRERRRRIFLS